ncbi:MAG: GAF sensor-containing diguanylate cyclase [Elusimicrobia bacterium]|nr:MAG: GAF sensor-containing diguanylate cyclase [Elusimicrobiota bacterium]KAF0155107.1 MAG: GAF sensor-containing diguanylate cyclase [Elusimicrobiota bacterium]
MIKSKTPRVGLALAVFAAVSAALSLDPASALALYPLYGFVFLLLAYEDRDVKFLLAFLCAAAGFVLPRFAWQDPQLQRSLLMFLEMAALLGFAWLTHYVEDVRKDASLRVEGALAESSRRLRALEEELARYETHKKTLLDRIRFQSGLSSSIQHLSASSSPEEIKARLGRLVRDQFFDAPVELVPGAPRDPLEAWSAERKVSLLVRDSASDNRFSARDFSGGERSAMVVPLSHFGSTAGFIRLSSQRPERFGTEDLRAVELLAAIAGVATENLYLYERVGELAVRDALTGLYTHRAFQTRLEEEILRAARSKVPFSVLLSDIDHFKSYNDRFGHQAGDHVLKTVAAVIAGRVRGVDLAARYGGEEFAVILPGVAKAEAAAAAEALRQAVEAQPFSFGGAPAGVTVSFGVAEFPSEAAIPSQLVRVADERLYRAKKEGRNRVIHA